MRRRCIRELIAARASSSSVGEIPGLRSRTHPPRARAWHHPRVLEVALQWIALARPRGAVLIASLPLVGFGYAHWERGSTVTLGAAAPRLALLAGAWLVGHAGAMWLNAHLDRDRGPVLLGRPVPVPPGTALAGYLALIAAPLVAMPLGAMPFACSLACAILAVLYSHPRIALKGRAVGGPLVNGVGYGALSPLAGFAAGDGAPTWRAAITLVLGVLFILGTYFAAQAFQADEDRRRGYRTLVVTHGPAWTLAVAHGCLRAAVIGALACTVAGAYPRALLASIPVWWLADRHLVAWRRAPASDCGGALVARLAAGVVVCIALAYADHFWLLAEHRPAGGCGTAIVPDALLPRCR